MKTGKFYTTFFCLLILCGSVFSQKEPVLNSMSALPEFSFTNTEGVVFGTKNLTKERPVIFFYFDPDCDHCQQQATWVKESISSFKEVDMVWVSWGEMSAISEFGQSFFGESLKDFNITFSKDHDYKIDSYFGYSEVPSIYIYNKDWKQTAALKKETPVSDLLKYINQ